MHLLQKRFIYVTVNTEFKVRAIVMVGLGLGLGLGLKLSIKLTNWPELLYIRNVKLLKIGNWRLILIIKISGQMLELDA